MAKQLLTARSEFVDALVDVEGTELRAYTSLGIENLQVIVAKSKSNGARDGLR